MKISLVKVFPWWVKVIIKLFIGLMPFSYEKVRFFITRSHGSMVDEAYALKVYNDHFDRFTRYSNTQSNNCFMELGPGGSLACGIFALAHGFQSAVLVDVGDFAHSSSVVYSKMLEERLGTKGEVAIERLRSSDNPSKVFSETLGVHYLTGGLSSLKRISDERVSFSMSQAVIEHVRKDEIEATFQELFRVHETGSISSHRVDFRDHLGGGLNHLRFSERIWENRFFPNSGFYTNRLRFSEVEELVRAVGFRVLEARVERWEVMPIKRENLCSEFRNWPLDDLLVRGADLVLLKP